MREETAAECALATRLDLRHNRAYVHQLLDSTVPRAVFDLYMAMCDEAAWREGGHAGTRAGGALQDAAVHSEVEAVGENQALITALRAELQSREAELHDRSAEVERLQAQLQASEAEVARLRAQPQVRDPR